MKKLKVYMDNEPLCILVLEDQMDGQSFTLPLDVDWNKLHDWKFEIMEVYKGLKYDDVAISHVDFIGCCVAEGTMIESSTTSVPIEEIKEGSIITAVDPSTGAVMETAVSKVSSVIHNDLLEVRTETQTLILTKDHQLFIRDIGFCSLALLKTKLQGSHYADLNGEFEVMVWNVSDGKLAFAKVVSVQQVEGSFKTYAIRGLEHGTSYLVNGFVTKTY